MHDPPACGIPTQLTVNSKPIGSREGDCDEGSSRYFTGGLARCLAEVSTNAADVFFGMDQSL